MSGFNKTDNLDPEIRSMLDAVVERYRSSRLTFTEEEAFQDIWDTGREVSPQMDDRFVLAYNGNPRHWMLDTHTLANNQLLDALQRSEWDGREIENELQKMSATDGLHYVFCPVDPRFSQRSDGTWEPSSGEVDAKLTAKKEQELKSLGAGLLEQWKQSGCRPWTLQQIAAVLANLGWTEAGHRGAWMLVRTWLKRWQMVMRVGEDSWVLPECVPNSPDPSGYRVIPIRSEDVGPNVCEQIRDGIEYQGHVETITVTTKPVGRPTNNTRIGTEARWTLTLRTIHLTEGYVPVPPRARAAYPPRRPGQEELSVMKGKWYDTNEDIWVWLDRQQNRLFGPELKNQIEWCEAGQRLYIHWSPDVLILRTGEIDRKIQEEETRLVDLNALAELRAGLGESYRQSLVEILSEEPEGLTFTSLVEKLRNRQSHAVHAGTIRAILSVGNFNLQNGRWFVPENAEVSARGLRRVHLLSLSELPNEQAKGRVLLKSVAAGIRERLHELQTNHGT